MFEVVWADHKWEPRLAAFSTRDDADAFATRFKPTDGSAPDQRFGKRIEVRPIVPHPDLGPCAKWLLIKNPHLPATAPRIYLECPTGEECFSTDGESYWHADVYAPTRDAAIAKFEARFGVRFEDA